MSKPKLTPFLRAGLFLLLALLAGFAGFQTAAQAALAIGQKVPSMTVFDATGRAVRLDDFRGRHVVLEWNNPGCPFVRKHYESGAMQSLQREFMARGVVWLTVNSTADGSADFLTPPQWQRWMTEKKATPTSLVVDDEGLLGRVMGARSALHMFILNTQGELIYAGAIDSIASVKPDDLKTATNWVRQGLNEALSGKPLSVQTNKPYGCPITYRS